MSAAAVLITSAAVPSAGSAAVSLGTQAASALLTKASQLSSKAMSHATYAGGPEAALSVAAGKAAFGALLASWFSNGPAAASSYAWPAFRPSALPAFRPSGLPAGLPPLREWRGVSVTLSPACPHCWCTLG